MSSESELLIHQQRKERRKLKRGRGKTHVDLPLTNVSARPLRQPKVQQQHEHSNHKRNVDKLPVTAAISHRKKPKRQDRHSTLDVQTVRALQNDDAEIAALEAKLGLSDAREKRRLHKEYAKHEGYGDDFGEFLDDLDNMVERLKSDKEENLPSTYDKNSEEEDDGDDDDDCSDSADVDSESEGLDGPVNKSTGDSVTDSDEIVPMASPAASAPDSGGGDDSSSSSSDETSPGPALDADDLKDNLEDTYRPAEGEDIYGNVLDKAESSAKASKYIPPHMRVKEDSNSKDSKESIAAIKRSLNNSLNRLSEDTLITVSQSIARLYPSHPTGNVNACLWENLNDACLARSYLMRGLIPQYTAAIVGVHIQRGDAAHLAEYVIELAVTELYKELRKERSNGGVNVDCEQQDHESATDDKRMFNLMLLLCYLYNFDVVHCSLIYDVIRDLIKSFKEFDIELLLIILNHSGRSLRSDDPSALKAIVVEVQKRAYESNDHDWKNSSRVVYLVSAVVDLKNNKRRQQDMVLGEKTTQLRKLIGRVKSAVATNTGSAARSSDLSLRIRLNDILEAEGKGRWWRVGAAWEGKQHVATGRTGSNVQSALETRTPTIPVEEEDKDSKLFTLAAKYRMNTDIRRSIFCIVMGSADYEDAFEKLVRAGMLKSKSERETVRVVMETCGNEKTYNSFYEHLAKRICEYQTQSKFTFQLAYWDSFKQLDSMQPRKAANLAKLLFALVVEHRVLKLNVLKGVDMTSPDDLSETGLIFLTVFFTKLMEHFNYASDVTLFFESGLNAQRFSTKDSEDAHTDEKEALYGSLTLFFIQVLKSSPKYKKGSQFRSNVKAAIKACDADNFFI